MLTVVSMGCFEENVMAKITRKSQLVRSIIRKEDRAWIYTNLYRTCRTVKCYGWISDGAVCEITKFAAENGFDVQVDRRMSETYRGPTPVTIVRLPLDNTLV